MKRVFYVKTDKEGVLVSNRSFNVGNEFYLTVLDTNSNSFRIVTEKNYTEVASGKAKNMAYVKILVKKKLLELGVVFESETRNREAVEPLRLTEPEIEL